MEGFVYAQSVPFWLLLGGIERHEGLAKPDLMSPNSGSVKRCLQQGCPSQADKQWRNYSKIDLSAISFLTFPLFFPSNMKATDLWSVTSVKRLPSK